MITCIFTEVFPFFKPKPVLVAVKPVKSEKAKPPVRRGVSFPKITEIAKALGYPRGELYLALSRKPSKFNTPEQQQIMAAAYLAAMRQEYPEVVAAFVG